MRAVLDLDVDSGQLAHPCEASPDLSIGRQLLGDLGVPGDPQQQPAVLAIPLEDFETPRQDFLVVARIRGALS